ncbi:MAG: phosphoesterase, partial [Gammaproteobacteria bacterium]|nr:phosphoesterase [Gammaproteobacteria bacterium]
MALRAILLALSAGLFPLAAGGAAAAAPPATPPIRHVFVLLLENESYGVTFAAASPAPYLAHELPRRGALLSNYFGIGHLSLGNYIALVSGQAPNEATQLDCPTFADFVAASARLGPQGQLPGTGCVYPRLVVTLADQLEAAGFTWRGYMEDMGKDPARESGGCGH